MPEMNPLIKKNCFYVCPKVAYQERLLYGVKIAKIEAIENLTLGHLLRNRTEFEARCHI
jgi:hypothetical protein